MVDSVDKPECGTPRSDAFYEAVGKMGPVTHNVRWLEFAQRLERELAEANRDVVNLHECLRQAAAHEDSNEARLRDRVERLRGLCKSMVGALRDSDLYEQADEYAALIGDMEPPLQAARSSKGQP